VAEARPYTLHNIIADQKRVSGAEWKLTVNRIQAIIIMIITRESTATTDGFRLSNPFAPTTFVLHQQHFYIFCIKPLSITHNKYNDSIISLIYANTLQVLLTVSHFNYLRQSSLPWGRQTAKPIFLKFII
jgi:hypothetical protein